MDIENFQGLSTRNNEYFLSYRVDNNREKVEKGKHMFEWKEDYSVKIPLIDAQHKKLFEIGASINELLKDYHGQDSFDQILKVIESLETYTVYHFREEEKLMAHFEYPELKVHQEEHQKFIDYLNGLELDRIDRNQRESLVELVKFVAGWIFKHISNVDFRYSDFISKRM